MQFPANCSIQTILFIWSIFVITRPPVADMNFILIIFTVSSRCNRISPRFLSAKSTLKISNFQSSRIKLNPSGRKKEYFVKLSRFIRRATELSLRSIGILGNAVTSFREPSSRTRNRSWRALENSSRDPRAAFPSHPLAPPRFCPFPARFLSIPSSRRKRITIITPIKSLIKPRNAFREFHLSVRLGADSTGATLDLEPNDVD